MPTTVTLTLDQQRDHIARRAVMYRDNARYIKDGDLKAYQLWFSGSRFCETTIITAVLTAVSAGLATHLGGVVAGTAGAAEATTTVAATTRMGVLLQNGQRALLLGSRALAAPAGWAGYLTTGTAYEAYVTAGMCRFMAGFSVSAAKMVLDSICNGQTPPMKDLAMEVFLLAAFSALGAPGNNVEGSLSKSIFQTTTRPGMFLAAPSAGYTFLSAQTVTAITKIIMKDTKACSKKDLYEKALKELAAKGANVEGLMALSIDKLASDMISNFLATESLIRKEINNKSFKHLVPTSFRMFDMRGNTQAFDDTMKNYVISETLHEFWLDVGIAITDLQNCQTEINQKASAAQGAAGAGATARPAGNGARPHGHATR
ncbi:hypothetical protein [Roseibium aggregatum]|uniref:hypothetical protein n=1 Tax=Roseibium aggregatum TaxID=187304 RepID=UPI001E3C8F6D|nr:hypothetical protein [Roseibium aggregatum]UES49213.1 hypothetical protein GFK88_06110 [Roseibium aggregatum]